MRRFAAVAIMALGMATQILFAQTPITSKCPFGGPLTVSQIMGDLYPSRVDVDEVMACHVSFKMDLPTFDKLTPITSQELLKAIVHTSARRMTLAEAHALVAETEAYVKDGENGSPKNPLPTLAKLIADHQSEQQAPAPEVPARGEFETKAAYDARVESSKKPKSRADSSYKYYYMTYYAKFSYLIAALKETPYPVSSTAAYGGYDPDGAQLTANLSDGKYVFFGIFGPLAKYYKENWEHVQVRQRYEDDKLRYLYMQTTEQWITGLKPELARQMLGDLIWVDGETGYLWTYDPRPNFSAQYKGAEDFCSHLNRNGLTAWRVPTVTEYKTLLAPGYPDHFKPGLKLNGNVGYWSSTWAQSPSYNGGGYNAPFRFMFEVHPGFEEQHLERSDTEFRGNVMCIR